MLGDLTPSEFLREYWQKKPLLIRGAFPGFKGLLDREELIGLSCLDGAQSRIVTFEKGKWSLRDGPFRRKDFAKLPERWTLLVQGINHFLKDGGKLLSNFDFIPHARLDDLMVSYAPDGCGVGPHFDSYDVFLLQGLGSRRWQISSNCEMALVPDAPLRILKHFEPEAEWVLEPGDMLYLPPKYAHNGIAVGESMTYSIGFRAPSYQELATQFLIHLQDNLEIPGMYQDPDLEIQDHPAEIGKKMIGKVKKAIDAITWKEEDIEHFLGIYLSEPKPHLFFDPPRRPLSKKRFLEEVEKEGVRLDLRSQLLFAMDHLYVNGEMIPFSNLDRSLLKDLADRRFVESVETDEETSSLLYRWYSEGYVCIGGNHD